MLKIKVEFDDLDGVPTTQELLFNLTRTEIVKIEMDYPGGLIAHVEKIVSEKNGKEIMILLEKIIVGAYGERSGNSAVFSKSEEIRNNFKSSLAYDSLFMSLLSDPKKASDFMNSLVPKTPTQPIIKD